MGIFRGRRVILAAALTIALLGAGAGLAYAATTTKLGTSVGRVTIVTSDSAQNFTSESWTTVGSAQITANPGWHILVQFAGESTVSGTAGGWASIRVLVDGVEADPAVGIDAAFDHVESTSSWEGHGIQRARTVPTGTTHTIVVQAAMSTTGITMRLDDWVLTVWAINPSLPA